MSDAQDIIDEIDSNMLRCKNCKKYFHKLNREYIGIHSLCDDCLGINKEIDKNL